ncbi:hypothetical protein PG995_002743 [Apiospora arundinis]|uniref:Fungal N-terminal domain-containing protein n=1 Tax=Apiospora arundinis TaxID=335852 RepID=A0ABR2J544_9PEZI
MDPLTASALGLAGATVKGLIEVWEFLRVVQEIHDAPATAGVFVKLLKQVTEDFNHAMAFRTQLMDTRKRTLNNIHDKWIHKVLLDTIEELDDFGRLLHKNEGTKDWDFEARVLFVLKDQEALNLHKESLRGAHSRLLAAITTMHAVAMNSGLLAPLPLLGTGSVAARSISAPTVHQTKTGRRTSKMPSVSDDEDEEGATLSKAMPNFYSATSSTTTL